MTRHTDELLENAVRFAHDYYTTQEELLPQLLFEDGEGTPVVVVFPFTNDTEKHASLSILHEMLINHEATSYTVMTEEWVSMHPTPEAKAAAVRPSLDPNHVEVLTIAVVTRSGERAGAIYAIEREASGKVTNLIDTGAEVMAGGTFSQLFEPQP